MLFYRNLLFVHIPKNAGNSIRKVCDKERIKVISHNIRKRKKKFLSDYMKKRHIRAFCVSRNPYDRVVSAYFYLLGNTCDKADMGDYEKYIKPYTNFDDFIKNGLELAAKEQIHFIPQKYWIENKNSQSEIEFILKMENLQNEFDDFCDKMKINRYRLEKINTSFHDYWGTYYTDETKTIVQNIYDCDFKYFGYEK